LKKFHYDTALRAHPVGLHSALHVVGISQLLFGTDAPLRRSIDQVEGLRGCGLSEGELRQIDYENAQRLLNSSASAFGGGLHARQ
jgi:predicted TIM-barrel fold metal-dependent hydrolase